MKLIDIWIPVIVGMALWLAMMPATDVHAQPESLAPVAVAQDDASRWQPLAKDKIHDPANPAIKLLQEPGVALSTLPVNKLRMSVGSFTTVGPVVNKDGNKVDWAQALRDNLISPRRALTPPATGVEREELVMDMDMFLDIGGSMPIVRFPHLAHTMWLACANCHPAIFVPQAGANPLNMQSILSGEQCGICHRAVAFPPTDCARCHSVSQKSPEEIKVIAEAAAKAGAWAKIRAEAEHLPLPVNNFVSGSVALALSSLLDLPLALPSPSPQPEAETRAEAQTIARRPPSPPPALHDDQQFIPEQSARPVPQLDREATRLSAKTKSTHIVAQEKNKKQQQASAPICEQAGVSRTFEIACLEAEISRGLDTYRKLPRRKFVGARTQEYGYAQYIEDWRINVERIGNLNYPKAARQKKIYGSLQITVSIRADGSLESMELSRSSGQRILDEAARRIVTLAAPFAPLPPDIHKDIDILSITHTWTFTSSGRLESE